MEIRDDFNINWKRNEMEKNNVWDIDERQDETPGLSSGGKPKFTIKEMQKRLLRLPSDIKKDRNFVTWIEVPKANGKANKIPASVETGKSFNAGTNAHVSPELWTDLYALIRNGHHRAMYFTTKDNSRVMIDIDDCVTWDTGKPVIIPEAREVLERFDSYAELSPSLEGIRIIVNGETPLDRGCRGGKRHVDGREVGFEIIAYEKGATLTGNVIEGYDKPVKDNQDAIDWYCNRYLYKNAQKNQKPLSVSHAEKGREPGAAKKANARLYDDINNSLSFMNFIGQHRGISVRNPGDNTKQLVCPICNNQSASKNNQDSALVVYEDNLYCFRCKKSWNTWSYLQEFDGVTGKDRIETLCNYAGIDLNQYSVTDIKKTESTADAVPYYRVLARDFYGHQAYHYDQAKIYWVWSKDKLVWQIKDETDILNAFEGYSPDTDTSIANVKNRLFEEVRKIGRRNTPEEPCARWIQFNKSIIDYNRLDKKIVPEHRYFMKNIIPWDVSLESGIEYLDMDDRGALLEQSDTPYLDKLLIDWVGVDYLKTMYEIIGFVMIRDYPLNRIICLLGEGSNGKSCFIRLLEKVTGTDNYTSSDVNRLSNSGFESAKLYNKLMCTINEIDQSVFKQTALLKRLTGQDLINMEFKFKNPFDAPNYAKIVIATNTLPQTNDKSYGFFRRWLIIDFPNRFEEGRDPLLDLPESEMSKLCGKALKLIPQLLERGSFSKEGNLEQRKSRYQRRSSSVIEFINDYCDQVEGEVITCSDFRESYRDFCKDNGYNEKSDQAIGKEMTDIGYQSIQKRVNGPNTRVYLNLKWKNGVVNSSYLPFDIDI